MNICVLTYVLCVMSNVLFIVAMPIELNFNFLMILNFISSYHVLYTITFYRFVSGHAGSGKSKLVHQVKHTVDGRNGYMIVAKFDMMADGSRPDSVLFEALNAFFGTFNIERGADSKAQMRERITDTVRFGIGYVI